MAELKTFTLPVGTALRGDRVGALLRSDVIVVCHPDEEWLIRAAMRVPADEPRGSAAGARAHMTASEIEAAAMNLPITCKREGDEVVVRIPAACASRLLVAVEGPSDIWTSGWLISEGATGGSPRALLNRLSASGVSQALASSGPCQSQASALALEIPKCGRPCQKAPCLQSPDAQDPSIRSACKSS